MAEGPGSPRHLPGVFEALVGAAIGAACSPGVIYCWRLISDSEPPKWAEDTLTNAVGAALVLGLIAFVGSLLRRRWHWTSKAAGDRLAIYVAFLEGDYSDDLRRSVIATIGKPLAAAGVEVLRAGTLLKEDSQGDALKATIKARKLLTRKGGHLLVWGRVLREAPRTVVELHFMSRADELEGDRFGLTEMLFIEPRLLSQMGGVIAGFAVVAARAASKDARAYAASESLSLAGGLKQLLGGRQEGFRQHDRTQICFAYGLLQSVIGDQTGDPDRLKEAAQAYRDTLDEWTQERAPRDWVTAKSNLALVLARLGKREKRFEYFEEAVTSYREILSAGAGAQTAVERALTKSNLCAALAWVGQRDEAVALGREALREIVRRATISNGHWPRSIWAQQSECWRE